VDIRSQRLYSAHREGLDGQLAQQERLGEARAEALVAAWEAEAERIGLERGADDFWPLGRAWIAELMAEP
jgi:hypothetical protein